ncbi:ribose-5-phosphate isomerase RpiA [Luteibacter aegosomatis]|uniref:ribose-5-phosphate isomerase RpiA n=1 Tax=Luteibacter aegosomatis TaxID=2911537 RepID=UPI001FFA38CD|nr:ribose-5-phosphate isomerase RpiA [Luteibacter aegosomatis]UPG86255.1 ribose-5-phosphate isomerase RpiA [Luteibacter aegosomatis]
MSQDNEKRLAAETAAFKYVGNGSFKGGIIGVGTGSTVNFFIDELPQYRDRIKACVSSSEASSERLRKLGFDVMDLNAAGRLDLYVDGADECDPNKCLIKGGGAALTREKIVAAASDTFVCIIDATKQVPVLGTFPLPIEVIPMARSLVAREITAMGGTPVWRDGVVTDNGNWIIDVHGWRITDPVALEAQLNQIVGIVCVGLFAKRRADVVIVGNREI